MRRHCARLAVCWCNDFAMIDIGRGPALVLIPGIQGRWEWMRPAIDALARNHRVFAFSLSDVAGDSPTFDGWAQAIDDALDRSGVESAGVIGVSFGGQVAMHYAAVRPARVRALVLASTPSPRWRPDRRSAFYMRWPRLVMPLLAVRSVSRLLPEILAARATRRSGLALASEYAWRAIRYPLPATRMVRWVEAWLAIDLAGACRHIEAPTTLITGERELERVVPVESTLEIAQLIPHASHVTFPGTGHVGSVTRPDAFAQMIVNALADAEADATNAA